MHVLDVNSQGLCHIRLVDSKSRSNDLHLDGHNEAFRGQHGRIVLLEEIIICQ
jgi:hypothetical protein